MAKKVIIIGGIGNGSVIAEAIEEAYGKNSGKFNSLVI